MSFKDISYLELWWSFCSAEQNHLCNFGRGYYEEQFCEIILTLDKWFRSRWLLKIFLIWSCGGPFVQRAEQLCNFGRALVGISGTTAKSRKRKFVPSSHMGPFALVASPGKNKTRKVLLLVLIFCEIMSKLCKNPAMLFHVDMIYLAKQAKLDVEKSFALR